MPAKSNALGPSRAAALDDIYLAPGRVDPNAEAGEFAIPEDRVLTLDGQPVDGSFGECELGSSRHRIESRLKPFVQRVMEGMTAQSEGGRDLAECGVAIVFLNIVTL